MHSCRALLFARTVNMAARHGLISLKLCDQEYGRATRMDTSGSGKEGAVIIEIIEICSALDGGT